MTAPVRRHATFDLLEAFKGVVIYTEVHQCLGPNVGVDTAGSLRPQMLVVIHFEVAGGDACLPLLVKQVKFALQAVPLAHCFLWRWARAQKRAIRGELGRADGLRGE